ncbi:MAG TPA: hypothetical protein VGR26_18460 [Acidimicrobiales bacterium]|nr:hypothetical protein [Acidimicrobiales bacterium]
MISTGVAILMGILAAVVWRNRSRVIGRGPLSQQVVLYFVCLLAIVAALAH